MTEDFRREVEKYYFFYTLLYFIHWMFSNFYIYITLTSLAAFFFPSNILLVAVDPEC